MCTFITTVISITELSCWIDATNKKNYNLNDPKKLHETVADKASFKNCAQWPRMMNSWNSFLIWTVGVILAVKYQIAATKISNIIQEQSLADVSSKRRILVSFGILYSLSLLLLVAFQFFCADYKKQTIRYAETWFVTLATLFLIVLFTAYLLSF